MRVPSVHLIDLNMASILGHTEYRVYIIGAIGYIFHVSKFSAFVTKLKIPLLSWQVSLAYREGKKWCYTRPRERIEESYVR